MFETERREGACIVHVVDDLDIVSKDRLAEVLAAAERLHDPILVVSLERCSYCDSTGLAELLKVQRRLGARFAVVVPLGSQCRRIFEIAGLTSVIRVCSSIDAALAIEAKVD
ncbi:MAG: hypothetical protein NVSMB19_20960 [Vulcanimicrobiaceae bacterium]